MSTDIQLPEGNLVENNDIIDTSRLTGEITNEDLKEFFLVIVQQFNKVRQAVNTKETGTYVRNEFVSGNVYFSNPTISVSIENPQIVDLRSSITQSYFVGALANAGVTTIPHGITFNTLTTFVRIWGVANKMTAVRQSIPLPYVDVSGVVIAGNIELRVDSTNIYITTTGDGTAYTQNNIFLEYLQQ